MTPPHHTTHSGQPSTMPAAPELPIISWDGSEPRRKRVRSVSGRLQDLEARLANLEHPVEFIGRP